MRRTVLAMAAAPAGALLAACLLAACGSSNPAGPGTTSSTVSATTPGSSSTVAGSTGAGSTGTGSTGTGSAGSGTTGQTGTAGAASGGSVTATITPPSGGPVQLTAGSVTCTLSNVGIVLEATGRTASNQDVTLAAGVEGGYTGPGTYSFSQEGPAGSVSVGQTIGGTFMSGELKIAPGAHSATVTAKYVDEHAASSGAQNITGSVQAALSWSSCPQQDQ
jgi:hypothetical protein